MFYRIFRHSFGDLPHDKSIGGHVEPAQFGNDVMNDAFPCKRQRALLDDLEGSIFGIMFHRHDDASGAGDKIHRASHTLHHLPRNRPIGKVALPRNLHGAQDAHIHMPAADHGKRLIAREEAGTWKYGHGLFTGIDQIGIFLVRKRRGANSQQTILRLQNDLNPRWYAGRDSGGQTDAEIDIEAVLQFPGNPPCDKLFTVHLDTPPRYSVRDRNISATGLSHQK
jgi:hypothetical protein